MEKKENDPTQEIEKKDLTVKSQGALMDPVELNKYATGVAITLTKVIGQKAKKVIISGEQYLEYEDWQTVAAPFGITVATGDPEYVEIEGVKGAKAKAIVYKNGVVIGGADAYCMRDEANWTKKPWFQLASMAQTRAGAKALRNVLSWVVVLAGYKTTPAEEIINDNDMTDSIAAKKESKPAPEPKPAITVKQSLLKKAGEVFNVMAIVHDTAERNTSKGTLTDYKVSDAENGTRSVISKFGSTIEGLQPGSVLIFKNVRVSTYQGNLTYLASDVEIVGKK